jgi:hypothetical protein
VEGTRREKRTLKAFSKTAADPSRRARSSFVAAIASTIEGEGGRTGESRELREGRESSEAMMPSMREVSSSRNEVSWWMPERSGILRGAEVSDWVGKRGKSKEGGERGERARRKREGMAYNEDPRSTRRRSGVKMSKEAKTAEARRG